MREIKFRAWDLTSKQMYFNGDNFGTTHDYEPLLYKKQGQDVEEMQYIEQHDISGEAIYEGDIIYIVKDRFGVDRHEVWTVQYMDGIPMACNQVNSFRAITPSFSEYYVNSENVTSPAACFSIDGKEEVLCKVHGNIYENPELLL